MRRNMREAICKSSFFVCFAFSDVVMTGTMLSIVLKRRTAVVSRRSMIDEYLASDLSDDVETVRIVTMEDVRAHERENRHHSL